MSKPSFVPPVVSEEVVKKQNKNHHKRRVAQTEEARQSRDKQRPTSAGSNPAPATKRKRRTKAQIAKDQTATLEATIKKAAAKRGHKPGTEKFKSYRRGWLNKPFIQS